MEFEKLSPKKYGEDGKCPECGEELNFDYGELMSYESPEIPPAHICNNCGWESSDVKWQEYPRYDAEISDLQEKVYNLKQQSPEIKITIESIFENAPEGNFLWDFDEGGDWNAYACGESDCESGWHLVSYGTRIGRKNGKRFIEVESGDIDGNWELSYSWEDGEDSREILGFENGQLRNYFLGWSEYWLHCAETGTDVLNQMMVAHETSDEHYEFCINAVKEQLRGL